ncbi:hypothetical protein B0T13DRAFT_502442 [Neurospora crassa]|nr:hypothetical protein B0T13DRAFT_502442 [Neurospora crassa]
MEDEDGSYSEYPHDIESMNDRWNTNYDVYWPNGSYGPAAARYCGDAASVASTELTAALPVDFTKCDISKYDEKLRQRFTQKNKPAASPSSPRENLSPQPIAFTAGNSKRRMARHRSRGPKALTPRSEYPTESSGQLHTR